jgi:hypothetical protein
MRVPSAGKIFVMWLLTLIGLAVASDLFLLLAYEWRTYAVLAMASLMAYLFTNRSRERRGRNDQKGAWERTPYEPTPSTRPTHSLDDWED